MKKYQIVDYLRGYSIFTIALMHLVMGSMTGVLSKAFAFGGAGVHVFILCSGFGLYLSHLKKPLSFGDFLKRRFAKVWVPYAIAVLLWGGWNLLLKGIFPLKEVSSHLFLYKMFSVELDTSLCYPYWFISTIVQFYLCWPLIVRTYRMRWGIPIMFFFSLSWSSVVGLLGLEEERPWGSFFLQYLWEFGLGMWIAERCIKDENHFLTNVSGYNAVLLMFGAVLGMGLSALMAWNGGILKLYNDIPSLIGYLSVALLVYKLGVKVVNRFFEWANSFSYDLYLVHSLVYTILAYIVMERIPIVLSMIATFISAYVLAYVYGLLMKKIRVVK